MNDPMQDIRVPKKRNGLRAAGAFSLLVVVFCTGLYLGVHEALLRAQAPVATSTAPGVTSVSLDFDDRDQPSDVDMSQFWRAWKVLQESFVEVHASGTLPNEEEQIYGAIRGLVESYGDPYTVFFEPPDAAIFNADVKGSFGGVGMEVGSDNSGNLMWLHSKIVLLSKREFLPETGLLRLAPHRVLPCRRTLRSSLFAAKWAP